VCAARDPAHGPHSFFGTSALSRGEFHRAILDATPIGPALALIGSGLRRQHWRNHRVDFQMRVRFG